MSKRVLVTGSSRGIGRSIAENLSKEGYEVIIHYSKDQKNFYDLRIVKRLLN